MGIFVSGLPKMKSNFRSSCLTAFVQMSATILLPANADAQTVYSWTYTGGTADGGVADGTIASGTFTVDNTTNLVINYSATISGPLANPNSGNSSSGSPLGQYSEPLFANDNIFYGTPSPYYFNAWYPFDFPPAPGGVAFTMTNPDSTTTYYQIGYEVGYGYQIIASTLYGDTWDVLYSENGTFSLPEIDGATVPKAILLLSSLYFLSKRKRNHDEGASDNGFEDQ